MSLSPSTQKAGARDHLSPVQEKPGYRAKVLGGGGGVKKGWEKEHREKRKHYQGTPTQFCIKSDCIKTVCIKRAGASVPSLSCLSPSPF